MFRPFRKHGPSPFEVMSSTWRDAPRGDQPADAKATQTGDKPVAIAPQPAAPAIKAEPPASTSAPAPVLRETSAPSVAPATPPKAAPASTPAVAKAPAKAPARPAVARAKPAPSVPVAPAKPKVAPPVKPKQPAAPRVTFTQRINFFLAWIGRTCATRWAIARTWAIRAWTKFQSRTRITRTHVGVAAGLFGLVLILYIVGNSGKATAPMLVQDPTVSDNNLKAIQPPANLPGANGQNPAGTQGTQTAQPGPGPSIISDPRIADANRPDPSAQPKPKMARGKADSREKGLRYYILATYSVNKEEYMVPLLEYLWSQGVEAGAFNAHNSGYFQVIALQGFSKDQINAGEHKKYEDALRRVGRLWKAEGGGDDNLSGMYIAEHKGVPLNVSITKAN